MQLVQVPAYLSGGRRWLVEPGEHVVDRAERRAGGCAHEQRQRCPAEVVGDPACDHDAGKEQPSGFLAVEGDRRDVVVAAQGSRSDLFLRQNRRTITMKVTVIVAETTAAISIPACTTGFIAGVPPGPVWLSHVEELT